MNNLRETFRGMTPDEMREASRKAEYASGDLKPDGEEVVESGRTRPESSSSSGESSSSMTRRRHLRSAAASTGASRRANTVLYLASDKAGFITGENICIDGLSDCPMIKAGDVFYADYATFSLVI